MQKYKKLFGCLIPHNDGEWARIQDIVDLLFPLAYKDTSERGLALREIIEKEIWGSESRVVTETMARGEQLPRVYPTTPMPKVKAPKPATEKENPLLGPLAESLLPKKQEKIAYVSENSSDFFAFAYQALLDKEKKFKDKYKFHLSTNRRWLKLKYDEWLKLNKKEGDGMNTVMEVNLLGFNPILIEDRKVSVCDATMTKIRQLWERLKDDPGFFIFFEGEYTSIRCSERNKRKVNTWAGRYKINMSDWQKWQEPWAHTNKFKSWYQRLFHLYTEALFMFEDEKDFNSAVDRVIHCFLNMQVYGLFGTPVREQINFSLREAMVISRVAMGRAFTAGHILGECHKNKKEKGDD